MRPMPVGVPQVYYVGALAGGNDMELLERTGVGRDINRHYYTADEIASDLERPVVRALFGLCRLRNTFPAFDGDLDATLEGTRLTMVRRGRQHPGAVATLTVDLATGLASITTAQGTDAHSFELTALADG